jgi:hypothetical protein
MEASPIGEPEAAEERDTADDWRIEPGRAVATVAELEGRIDVALATARTAEEAALEIGAASLEAAEQARKAAALAERASAAAARAAAEVAEAPRVVEVRTPAAAPAPSGPAPAPFVSAPPSEPAVPPSEPAVRPSEPAVPPSEPPAPPPLAAAKSTSRPKRRQPDPFDERLTAFRERAESVMIRLQRLEAGTPPGDGPTEVVRLR